MQNNIAIGKLETLPMVRRKMCEGRAAQYMGSGRRWRCRNYGREQKADDAVSRQPNKIC